MYVTFIWYETVPCNWNLIELDLTKVMVLSYFAPHPLPKFSFTDRSYTVKIRKIYGRITGNRTVIFTGTLKKSHMAGKDGTR